LAKKIIQPVMANERSGEVIPPPMHTDDSISTCSKQYGKSLYSQTKSSWPYMWQHVYV